MIASKLTACGWLKSVMDSRRGQDDSGVFQDDYDNSVKAAVKALSTARMGLIVSGEYGCGKTSFIRALTGFRGPPNLLNMNIPRDREILDPNGGYSDYPDLFSHHVVIDDLGAEVRNHYGEHDYSEARDFICEYHARGRGRLFITTNLRAAELLNIYGGRLVDRLKEIGVPVRMWGGSKRSWTV